MNLDSLAQGHMAIPLDTTQPSARSVMGELIAFLKRPTVLVPAGLRTRGAWAALAVMATVQVAVMLLVILPLISRWQAHFAQPMPDAFGKVPSDWLLPITLLLAPILEEMIFRGWQTGRPRAFWLLGCFVALVLALTVARPVHVPTLLAILAGLAAIAVAGWWRLRRLTGAPQWYRAAYPGIYWAVVFAFAALHLLNYPATTLVALPMVLPQLWAAILLGFTRQRIGLHAAILQHAVANSAAMLLAQIGG